MKILTRALFLVVLLGCLLAVDTPSVSGEPTKKTVLVFSPFQIDLSTNLIASQAIREEFGKADDLSLDVYYEYLDLNRFSDPAYQQNIFDLLTIKYKSKQVDLVIVGSEAMLKLWLAQRAEILPNTPIVFFDVFTEHLDALDLPGNVTGVSGTEDCTKSVRWLLEATPEVNEVVLVMGAGKIEQGFFDHIQKLQENMKGLVKFTNLSGLPLTEITQRVAKLPKTSIVLYHPMFEDAKGNKYRPLEVLQELTTASSVPVMGGYDQFIGTGIIGGYMYSIDQQARDAAQISLRILRGEAIDSIPIEQNESDRFIFDHLALQRFDLPLSLLPTDSIVKNRQYSFWELYRTQIILAIASFTLLLLLVAFLGITTQRLSKARSELKYLNENLESQVHERTAALSQTNHQLEQEVAERQQAEAALQESEARFRSYFELPLTGRAITSPDKGWIDMNTTLCEMLGYTKEELMQMTWAELTHPDDLAADLAQFDRILADEINGYDLEKRFLCKDGRVIHTHLAVQCLRDPDRSVDYVVALIQDITKRKQAEEALQASEFFINGVLNSLTAHIAVLDENGVIISVNEAWKKFATDNNSPDPDCYVGVNYLTVCETAVRAGEKNTEALLRGMKAVLAGSQAQFIDEYPCDAPDTPRWFTVTVLPQSQPLKGLIVVHQDITERKQAEEKLRESEEKFRSLLDSQESNIMVFDFDGIHHYVNQGAIASITSSGTSQDIIGKRLHDLYPGHIADWQLGQIRQVFTSGQGMSGDFRTGPEDHSSWWHLNLQPIRNASGQVTQVMVNSLDITERKYAEQALSESEARYRLLSDNISDVIWTLDPETMHFLYVSPSVEQLLGYTPDELKAMLFVDTLLPEVREPFLQRTRERVESFLAHRVANTGYRAEVMQFRKDGSSVWVEVVNNYYLNKTTGRVEIQGVSRDITERKQLEDDLRENERRTATILRLSPAVIGVSTVSEGRYTDVNDAFENVLGYSTAEAIGRTSFDLNLWVDEDTRSNVLREIQTRGRVENMEIRLRRKSGEVFPALIFITPIALHDTDCLLTMMMDITERKRAEEQLRETRDTLQTIIYSSPLAILTMDAEDQVTMWNPAAEGMFGWSDKQTLGKIDPTVPENKIREYEALRNATLSGMSFSNMDTVRMKKDGDQFPVSLSVAPLRGQQNEVIGRLHIITDITERKKLQEELRQQATTDELTKVPNRRRFIDLANSEIKRAIRLKRPPAVALIDIDHFKQINDTYGHATGDLALIAFTQICQKQIREIDVFARFGGDEFVLLFPETSQEQAYEIVERIRMALTTNPVDLDGRPVTITLSCGIASLGDEQTSFDALLNRADQALYRAKEAGRNRVVIETDL